MSKIGLKQFSVKVKAPWWVISRYPEDLKMAFIEKLGGFLTKKFRVSTRLFHHSQMCRFTVIFQENQQDPEAIEALVEKVAKRTMIALIADKTQK